MQELEREKDSLQLQVNVLEDQIEGQARRISDLGNQISPDIPRPCPIDDYAGLWLEIIAVINCAKSQS